MEDSVPAASGGCEDLEFHFLFFHIVQMTFKSAEMWIIESISSLQN